MSLRDIAVSFGTDKAGHGYCEHYENLIGYLADKPCVLLEIGVQYGRSLRMWREWMPRASIIGIDRDLGLYEPSQGIEVYEVAGESCGAWAEERMFDVIMDDAGHEADKQIPAFHILWPHVSPGGWYIIEDLPPTDPELLEEHIKRLVSIQGESPVTEVHLFAHSKGNGILFLRKRS